MGKNINDYKLEIHDDGSRKIKWFVYYDKKCKNCGKEGVSFYAVRNLLKGSKIIYMLTKCSECDGYLINNRAIGKYAFEKDKHFHELFHLFFKEECEEILGEFDFKKLTKEQKELLELNGLYKKEFEEINNE